MKNDSYFGQKLVVNILQINESGDFDNTLHGQKAIRSILKKRGFSQHRNVLGFSVKLKKMYFSNVMKRKIKVHPTPYAYHADFLMLAVT